jgi:hypothetical protein
MTRAVEPPNALCWELVQALMIYWRVNLHASDTLEGISQWWLGRPQVSEVQMAEALSWLAESEVVQLVRAADGRVRYRLICPESQWLEMKIDGLKIFS